MDNEKMKDVYKYCKHCGWNKTAHDNKLNEYRINKCPGFEEKIDINEWNEMSNYIQDAYN